MITCADAVKQLWAYLDNALPSDDFAKVEEHLAFCRKCCGEAEFAGELQGFLASTKVEQIPSDVKNRLEHLLDAITKG